VFGGPAAYTEQLGGYERMVGKHSDLMSEAADDAGLPDDPEFRSAFIAYLEWGTRIAMHNSQPGAEVPPHAPVPRWGWGEAPPFQP
jgi:hemoglobin